MMRWKGEGSISPYGGFLNIHADFTVHPLKPAWRRRVNILLYFNEKWPEAYGRVN